MARKTSIAAYREIEANGLLSERRWRVYKILFEHGPLIGAQVSEKYKDMFGRTSYSETIRNRIGELRNQGVVEEIGRQLDKHTGMNVILWDVTDRLPRTLKRSKLDMLHADRRKLETKLRFLNKKIAALTAKEDSGIQVTLFDLKEKKN